MMRPSKSALFPIFSAIVILTATAASQASTPAVHLGRLLPQGKWKVAAVNAQESTVYCAMTNQFDQEAVLSFLSTAEGQESIAIDFSKGFFQSGRDYDVTLRTDDANTRQFSGRAGSGSSIVVQVGQDIKFYRSLNHSVNLEVALSAVNATFALQKFSGSYGAFQDCAGGLHQGPKTAAVPVLEVEKSPLPPQPDNEQAQVKLQQALAVPVKDNEPAAVANKSLKENIAARVAQFNAAVKQQMQQPDGWTQTEAGKEAVQKAVVAEAEKALVPAPDRLSAQSRQAKVLKAALTAKEHDLLLTKATAAGDGKRLVKVQKELALVKSGLADILAPTQAQPDDGMPQYGFPVKQADARDNLTRGRPAGKEGADEKVTRKKIASISAGQSFDNVQIRTQEGDLDKEQEDLQRQAVALQKQAEWLESGKLRMARAQELARGQAVVEPVQQKKKEIAVLKEENPPIQDKKTVSASLAGVAPAVGTPESPSVVIKDYPPVPSSDSDSASRTDEFLDRIMAYHLPPGTKIKIPAADPVTLEGLLKGAGLAVKNFVPVGQTAGNVVVRWTSGKISGLYEQAAANGDFNSQAGSYIERYRQDCGKGLEVHLSPSEAVPSGAIAVADIECRMPSNAYTSSFLFLEDSNGFSTILHTSYPAGKAAVQDIRDKLVQGLKNSQGLAPSPAVSQSANAGSASERPSSGAADGLKTVVIQ
jgi:hypothetical protein